MIIEIADVRIKIGTQLLKQLTDEKSGLIDRWRYAYGEKEPAWTIETVVRHSHREATANQYISNGGFLYRDEGAYTSLIDQEGTCQIHWQSGMMTIRPKNGVTSDFFIKYLKILVSSELVRRGGALFHASAAGDAVKGDLFTGPSGAGKSTVATLLAPHRQILNDELNGIIPEGERYRIHATPFGPLHNLERGPCRSVALERIYLLEKGLSNRIGPLALRRKISSIVRNAAFLPLTDFLAERLLENAQKIVELVPVSLLRFSLQVDLHQFLG